MPRVWYSVSPRYTPGSPAQVDRNLAERVAREEAESFPHDRDGSCGLEHQQRATRLGLDGIAWAWYEAGRSIHWRDLVTGDTGSFRTPKQGPITWPWTDRN